MPPLMLPRLHGLLGCSVSPPPVASHEQEQPAATSDPPVDHRAIRTSEPQFRRDGAAVPHRWEDDKLSLPPQSQRELRAESIRSDGTYGPLDLDRRDGAENSPMSVYRSWSQSGRDCALACYSTLDAMGYEKPRGDKNTVLARGEIGTVDDGAIGEIDPEAAKKMLDRIDEALFEGLPVMLGVDYTSPQSSANSDNVTDHWLTLIGRTQDDGSGEVRYNAYRAAAFREFTVGEDWSLTSQPPQGAQGAANNTYRATNARVPERKP